MGGSHAPGKRNGMHPRWRSPWTAPPFLTPCCSNSAMSSDRMSSDKAVAYITAHYFPERGAPARRARNNVDALVSAGWDVTVVTQAPHYPQNLVYDGFGVQRVDDRVEAGVRVVRIRPLLVNRRSLPRRLMSELYFAIWTVVIVGRIRPSVVYSSVPYMFLASAAIACARLFSVKTVIEFRDLTWLYPRAVGKNTFGLEKIFEFLIKVALRKADGVVTSTHGQLAYLRRLVGRGWPATVVPTAADQELADKLSMSPQISGTRRRCRVVYAGLVGFAQRLETYVLAAKRLPDVSFEVYGAGPELPTLKRLAADLKVRNIDFHGHVGEDRLVETYGSADILVATLADAPIFEVTQPSKIWEYMLAGKPVVFSGAGEAAEAVRQSGGGVVSVPGDARDLAEKVNLLVKDSELRHRMGQDGRRFVMTQMRPHQVTATLEPLLDLVRASFPDNG